MKKFLLAAALATSAIVATAPASAAILNPGNVGVAFDPFIAATQGTLLASTTVSGTTTTFAATLRSAVYKNTLGTLDFYYQVARTGPGTLSDFEITSLTASDFGTWTVDAFVSGADPDAGGFFTAVNNPTPAGGSTTRVDRSPGLGSVITTDFWGTGFNGLIGTENSATYIFRTNATNFKVGTFGIIDGSTLDGLAFAPEVPEPATWAMMIGGFGVIGAAMRRTRLMKTVTA